MSLQSAFKSRPLYSNKAEIVTAVGVLMFMSGWFLELYDQEHLPTKPNPALGRIYELDDHGRLFYMTHRESIIMYTLIFGGWLVGAAGIWPKVQDFRKRWNQAK